MSDSKRTDEEVEAIADSIPDEYHFYVWPGFVLMLPMIVIGYALVFLGWLWPSVFSEGVCCQIFLIAGFYTAIILGFDFDSRDTGLIIMSIATVLLALGLLGFWIGQNIFGKMFHFFTIFDSRMTLSAVFEYSFLLSIIYIFMCVYVHFNRRVHIKGETMSMPSLLSDTKTYKLTGTHAPQMKIPDVLELAVCGIGALTVTDTQGHTVELRRIFNVRRKEKVLLAMTSTVDIEKEPDRI